MIRGKKVTVVMPAYYAEKTLEKTYGEIPRDVVDRVILVDDASTDKTVDVAKSLGIDKVIKHEKNVGYGGNQKTCYEEALKDGADVVVMLHADYQYTPELIEPLAWLVARGTYDVALGSRMLGNDVLKGGMPLTKYAMNRILTLFENIMIWEHLSEYHTGYRAYSRHSLEVIPFKKNSNNFLFDNQMLAQCFYTGFRVGEVSCPTKYFPEASSVGFVEGMRYSAGVVDLCIRYRLHVLGLKKYPILEGLERRKHSQQFSNPFKEDPAPTR